MRAAQEAIETGEVQAMMKRLAEFNLGVCMPHMHPQPGQFVDLPANMVAVERKTEFVPHSEAEGTLPVAWRWDEAAGAVVVARNCHINMRPCEG
jgi:hypothetical protein